RQGGEVELALLRPRGRRLVPQLPLLHPLREGDLLPRPVPEAGAARRVQAPRGALPRHLRGQALRRGAVPRLGEAGQPPAGRADVAGSPGPASATLRCCSAALAAGWAALHTPAA